MVRFMAVCCLAWGLACGSGGGGTQDATVAEVALADTGLGDDVPIAEVAGDVPGEAVDDVSADPGTYTVPFMPAPPAKPWVDEPYSQESNDNGILKPGLGPLVAVLGLDYDAFHTTVLFVTPRGWSDELSPASLHAIPKGDPDLVSAARTVQNHAPFFAGPTTLYRPRDDGGFDAWPVPQGRTILRLAPGETCVWILQDQALGRACPGSDPVWEAASITSTAVFERAGRVVVGGDGILSGYAGAGSLATPEWTLDAASGLTTGTVRAILGDVSLPVPLDLVVIGDAGLQGFRWQTKDGRQVPVPVEVPEFAPDRVPFDRPRTAAVAPLLKDFVVATAGGAYRMTDRGHGPEWSVYNAERWLASEDVRDVAFFGVPEDIDRIAVYFATAAGLSIATSETTTLEQKLAPFVDRIVARHDRDGAVADSHLLKKGDNSTNVPWDSDNDGSWTSYWLLAECFRWKVTGAADAKAHFDKSFEAMMRLRDLTGTDHFLARAVIRKEGCILDDCDDPDDGKWFTSPDGKWWVKRDTSNDEVIAHVFMMGHAYDLCADDAQKARIRDHIRGIVGGIVDHGYKLIDPITNVETTYGQWDPDYVNLSASGVFGDGGQRSVQAMAMLTLAHYLTGETRFADEKARLIADHHYDENAIHEAEYPARPGNGDGNEMSTEGWFSLLRYEPDPALRARWLSGWARTYQDIVVQQAAWWDMVNAIVGGAAPDLDHAMRWLRLAPVDMIRWNQHNSHRKDLIDAPEPYKYSGKMRSDGRILPYDERRCDRWNTHQYMVDGGMGGVIEMDGADVLAPYWMGRYYGFITAVAQ